MQLFTSYQHSAGSFRSDIPDSAYLGFCLSYLYSTHSHTIGPTRTALVDLALPLGYRDAESDSAVE
jgi:hypothetical protein